MAIANQTCLPLHAAGRTRRSRGCSCTHAYKRAFTQSQCDTERTTAARPRCWEGQREDRMQTEAAVTPGKTLGGEERSELVAALGCCMNPCVCLFVCLRVCVLAGGCFICLPVSRRLADGKHAVLDEKKSHSHSLGIPFQSWLQRRRIQ